MCHDPRWDRQVESREEYYAALRVRLQVDLAPIRRRLEEVTQGSDPFGVLGELARRGERGAARLLAGMLEHPGLWKTAFHALLGIGLLESVVTRRDVESLVAHAPESELVEIVHQAPGGRPDTLS